MRAIYERARKVNIYVNDDFGYQHEAFNLLDDLLRYRQGKVSIDAILADSSRCRGFFALQKFFSHHYWHRIWVVQEIASARDTLVFFGSRRIQLEDLVAIQEDLHLNLRDEIYRLSTLDPSISAISVTGGGPTVLGLPPKTLPLPDL